jgi:hypothetical protein
MKDTTAIGLPLASAAEWHPRDSAAPLAAIDSVLRVTRVGCGESLPFGANEAGVKHDGSKTRHTRPL